MKVNRMFVVWMATCVETMRAFGCAACFGRSDSPLAVAANWGILALLVVIVAMLGLISTFFVFVARRQARLKAEPENASRL